MTKPIEKRRIFELDLLRGFFIIVIIIDHLQFWPSPLALISGQGRLWVSAAEGFFLISGLLIGYIRGYKGQKKSLSELSKKLLLRAGMLYIWGVLVTFLLLIFTAFIGNNALLPDLPSSAQLSNFPALITAVLTSDYFSGWIYFLRLYAIMLAVTPLFLYLLRRRKEWLIVMLMLAAYGISFVYPEGGLQWQMFFFGAALIGYRLESIATWLRRRPRVKTAVSSAVISLTLITMVVSYYLVFHAQSVSFVQARDSIGSRFTLDPVSPARIGLSFLWFSGLLFLVHRFKSSILKYFGWLLIPLGERSLSGYILQALLLPFIVVSIPISGNQILNTVVPIATVLAIWYLLQLRAVEKIIPR